MKNLQSMFAAAGLAALFYCGLQQSLLAQGSTFTYQGRLEDSGVAYNGTAEFQPTLWESANGGNLIATNNPATLIVGVTNGLFVLPLDFGIVFPGDDRWVQLEVRTDAGPFTTLSPRQPITMVPYAMTARTITGSIGSEHLGGTYSNPVTFGNAANNFAGSFTGNASGLTALNASQLTTGFVPDARLEGNIARTNQVWGVGGNSGTVAGTHFIGTTDNQPLEFKVDNSRAFRLSRGGSNSVNVIAGWEGNWIAPNVTGSTIGGGGAGDYHGFAYSNRVDASFATVSGGFANRILPFAQEAVIGGGAFNTIHPSADASVIGGGRMNTIEVNGFRSTILGGTQNSIEAAWSTIGGGSHNKIHVYAGDSTIAGGAGNVISSFSAYGVIGGGVGNYINTNSSAGVIPGGVSNKIQSNAPASTIGGGWGNNILSNSVASTIAGGTNNVIHAGATHSTISGGGGNAVHAYQGTIGGGGQNIVEAYQGTIGGGAGSIVSANVGTIAGGNWNIIYPGAHYSSIGGGYQNFISTNANRSTVSGGTHNRIHPGAFESTIGGGYQNDILTNSAHSTIAGGYNGNISTNSLGATIGGGYANFIRANGTYATIPGGSANAATNYAFAAGYRAKANHTGSFVWGDSTNSDIVSTSANSVTMRASGGYRLFSNSGASTGVSLAAGSGSWTSLSDRNAKENFCDVDGREVLERVIALPVHTWNYKSQESTVRHIGPTAQDFYAAFGVGETETGISTVDADGVALAAIQGLHQIVKEKDAEIQSLKSAVEELRQVLNELSAASKGGQQ
ncbi:MAG: tail fiber domain-containing protein [Limisphaerales bacterium]